MTPQVAFEVATVTQHAHVARHLAERVISEPSETERLREALKYEGEPKMSAVQKKRQMDELGFYSAAREAVDASKQGAMSGGDWLRYLKDPKRQVKADELKWTGIEEYLKENASARVSKADVLALLDKSDVRVREVAKGATDAKFRKYTLPGGERYTERLLTLPVKTKAVQNVPSSAPVEVRQSGLGDWYTIDGRGNWSETKYPGRQAAEAALEANRGVPTTREEMTNENFTDGHWDEPNVLAHTRLNIRTDADGKRVLFVEEIQSDWAQKGRREGFRDEIGSKMAQRSLESLDDHMRERWGDERWYDLVDRTTGLSSGEIGGALRSSEHAAIADNPQQLATLIADLRTWGRAHDPIGKEGAMPSAPFVGSTDKWTDLALKRILRIAAEEGLDRVSPPRDAPAARSFSPSSRPIRRRHRGATPAATSRSWSRSRMLAARRARSSAPSAGR